LTVTHLLYHIGMITVPVVQWPLWRANAIRLISYALAASAPEVGALADRADRLRARLEHNWRDSNCG
jgi:hypothetical protein